MKTPRTSGSEFLLGHRIRSLRSQLGWTLDTAAKATGLARSTISKIENGQMSPTYDALIKLAQGFDVDISDLFESHEPVHGSGRRSITRAGNGQPFNTAHYQHMLLCNDLSRKVMTPFRSVVTARDFGEFEDWSRHEGEEFVYILKGEVEMSTEFYEPVRLGEGDCAYLDSRMGHRVISVSKEDAVALWVSTTNPRTTPPISLP
jgi:DNA-binding XRE family transcriptional regulator/mannose-6-phosphate isomerase-like protein (cupin superfamily)